MSTTYDEARAMGHVLERVQAKFPGADPQMIRTLVEQELHQYDGRPIREFVPVLVEREVTQTLRRTLPPAGRPAAETPPTIPQQLVPQSG